MLFLPQHLFANWPGTSLVPGHALFPSHCVLCLIQYRGREGTVHILHPKVFHLVTDVPFEGLYRIRKPSCTTSLMLYHPLFFFSLRFLNASANALESLPSMCSGEENGTRLQVLYLTNNQLTDQYVPFLTVHVNLRVLHMAYNQLETFPARWDSQSSRSCLITAI